MTDEIAEAFFTCDELREAYLAYSRAIKLIEALVERGAACQGWQTLKSNHEKKLSILESAQRVLNSHRLLQ